MLPLYVCATLGLALLVQHLVAAQTQPEAPRLASSLPWPAGSSRQQQQQPGGVLLPPVFEDAPATPRVTLCTLVRALWLVTCWGGPANVRMPRRGAAHPMSLCCMRPVLCMFPTRGAVLRPQPASPASAYIRPPCKLCGGCHMT